MWNTFRLNTLGSLWLIVSVAAGVGLQASGASGAVDVYVTNPISGVMILPDSAPASLPGKPSSAIAVTATPGEYEPASFVVRSSGGIPALRVLVGDLKCGALKIPASAVDVKAVKCWYQSKGAWKTITRLGYTKTMVPELLLNDSSLIKADTTGKENYIKLKYADGSSKYVCISKKPNVELEDLVPQNTEIYEIAPGISTNTPIEKFPVKDSATLLPVSIGAGQNQQFWLTIHVPDGAKPGVYKGTVKLVSSGKPVKSLDLKVTVLPFKLSEPRTFYDSSREFTSSIYDRGMLDPKGKGSTTTDSKSPKQFLAELTNMREHGVTNPMICIPYSMIEHDDALLRKMLSLRKKAGITGPFYLVFDVVTNQQDPKALAELEARVKHYLGIAGEFGIPDFYFYGIDEASGDLLKSERAAWTAARKAGGKMIVSGYDGIFEEMGDILDVLVKNGPLSTEEAAKWHSVGHRIFSYANPQSGIENPELYRRNFGFKLWKSNYDGASTFTYQVGNGGWNDFNDIMRDLNFTYPTVDGVIDTIAWEGYREGIDDIRYGTTLKLAIEKAKGSSSEAKRRAAEAAEQFLGKIGEKDDMDQTRQGVIDHILAIQSAK